MRVKTKRRSLVYLLVCFLATILSGFIFNACNSGENPLSVADWGNVSVERTLGDYYEVPTFRATSADGSQEYDVKITVIKKNGNVEIPLINNAFDVMDIGGYTVRYTATDGKKSATKLLDVRVVDGGDPVILCKSAKTAEQGKKYYWSNIQVVDGGGAIDTYGVQVYDVAAGQRVASDKDGFTPASVGEYELRISATDATGNTGTLNYRVYSRKQTKTNELDAFDDKGGAYTAYALEGTQKQSATYSYFTRLQESGGSVMVRSVKGEQTSFYMKPRKTDLPFTGNGYISAWIYIVDPIVTEREIVFMTSSLTVKTNEWTEVKLTTTEVGAHGSFLSKLETGDAALLTVKNHTSDYALIVDDVYYVQGNVTATGFKDGYALGESVNFSTASNVVADCLFNGVVTRVANGFTPTQAGKYTVSLYDESRAGNVYAHTFTVGDVGVEFDDADSWFVAENNVLPRLVDSDTGASISDLAYAVIDLETGEKTAVQDGFVAPSEYFFLLAEGVYKGKETVVFKGYGVHEHAQGVWTSFDDASSVLGMLDATWYEEYDGEYGVVEVYSPLVERNTRPNWIAEYQKEYYAQFDYLKIRAKSDQKFSFSFLQESKWSGFGFNDSQGNRIGQWTDYYIDMANVLPWFDGLNNELLIVYASASANVHIWISEIVAVNKPQAAEKSWYDTDSPIGANYDKMSWLEEKDGETGVFQISVTTATTSQTIQNPTLSVAFDKAYYEEFDYIVFKVKSEVDCKLAYGTNGTQGTPWKFSEIGELENGWRTYAIDIDYFLEHFDVLTATQIFLVSEIAPHERTFNIYISDVRVKKEGESDITQDDDGNSEAGNSWKENWS